MLGHTGASVLATEWHALTTITTAHQQVCLADR